MIWKNNPTLEGLNAINSDTMVSHLEIEITEIGDNYLCASMPVNGKTKQPMGLLHGGASAALSETMGSIAGVLLLDNPMKQQVVGVELSVSHLKSARDGKVYSKTSPIKIGRRIQVWNTDIFNDKQELICNSKLTTMVI